MARKPVRSETAENLEIAYGHVDSLDELKADPDNPRSATDAQIAGICRSIIEFGLVDPLIVRRSDKTIIGGHQRSKAIARLLSGPFKYRGRDGKQVSVTWKVPPTGIPVVWVDNLDDKKMKLLNLALNRATGEWDHDQLATLIKNLSDSGLDVHELGASAFTPAEITDYIDIAGEKIDIGDLAGEMPKPATKAPSLSLDFSSKELRDAVKAALGAGSKAEELSGDALARLLNVSPKKRPSLAP